MPFSEHKNKMNSRMLFNSDQLLEIVEKKLSLLKSVSEHFEHIESNAIFIEEIQEAYMEFDNAESNLISEKSKTVGCSNCGFECDQIHSFCLACGTKLNEQYGGTTTV